MHEPKLTPAIALVQDIAAREFEIDLHTADIENVLRSLLFEPRHLWHAAQTGLVTRAETAGVVAAHVHRWLMDLSGRPWAHYPASIWDPFITDMEKALFSPPARDDG